MTAGAAVGAALLTPATADADPRTAETVGKASGDWGTVPAAVLVMLTGNNLILEGDSVSLIIEIYLDAQTERPEDRVFKRDILAWTAHNRGAIVEKALTICKAYLDAGAPAVGAPATRFPTWDKMVRQAIVWAGGEDIAAAVALLDEKGDVGGERAVFGHVAHHLLGDHGDGGERAAELMGAGATRSLMADDISACAIGYTPGAAGSPGLVTLELSVGAGESISLLSQARMDNLP